MPEQTQTPAQLGELLDGDSLREWLIAQRWYGAKTKALTTVEVIERAQLRDDLFLVIVQTGLVNDSHETYQLLVLTRPREARHDGVQPIAVGSALQALDGLAEPDHGLALLENILADADIRTRDGCFAFRHVSGAYRPAAGARAWRMNVEQSNTTVVIDDRTALKLVRKVESGINPELEMLRFLTARGFEHIASLEGWYEYEGAALASTLGIAQRFVTDGRDGWELALEEIVSAPEQFLARLEALGQVTARMHTTLASDPGDPAFSPEEPSDESLPLLTASIDEDIERIFMRLEYSDVVAPIYGRGEDVRAQLDTRSRTGVGGKHIRIHGDYHLGQTLDTPHGWVILDFEGEPARPLPDRRMKRSPLKDVAGMLRSIAYATSAIELQRGQHVGQEFEARARERFLDAYLASVDHGLLPAGNAAIANLLAIFELEKAIYELRYELNNRPAWVGIPVSGIDRLLEAP